MFLLERPEFGRERRGKPMQGREMDIPLDREVCGQRPLEAAQRPLDGGLRAAFEGRADLPLEGVDRVVLSGNASGLVREAQPKSRMIGRRHPATNSTEAAPCGNASQGQRAGHLSASTSRERAGGRPFIANRNVVRPLAPVAAPGAAYCRA